MVDYLRPHKDYIALESISITHCYATARIDDRPNAENG